MVTNPFVLLENEAGLSNNDKEKTERGGEKWCVYMYEGKKE